MTKCANNYTVEATTKLLEGQAVEIGVRPEHLRLSGPEDPPLADGAADRGSPGRSA